jgi:hypothetical protein
MFPTRLAWDAQAVAATERFFHGIAASPEESQLLFTSFVR